MHTTAAWFDRSRKIQVKEEILTANRSLDTVPRTHITSDKYSPFIKQLNQNPKVKLTINLGGIEGIMKTKKTFSPQKRKQLQNKLYQALKAELQTLSTEMQQILCDDLVTAFQNRLIVLAKTKPKHS